MGRNEGWERAQAAGQAAEHAAEPDGTSGPRSGVIVPAFGPILPAIAEPDKLTAWDELSILRGTVDEARDRIETTLADAQAELNAAMAAMRDHLPLEVLVPLSAPLGRAMRQVARARRINRQGY